MSCVSKKSYVWHPVIQMKELEKRGPKIIIEGKGCIIKDVEGNEYIDGMGGISTSSVGHGRQEIIQSIIEQGRKIEFMPLFDGFLNEPAIRLSQKLAEIVPGNLSYVQFGCSGSEAIEIALKIARQYQRKKGFPNRYKVIARKDAYHGVTMGALSATGFPNLKKFFEPLVPGFYHIPAPNCFHCPFGKKKESCAIECAEVLEKELIFQDPDTVAAVIMEIISISTGVILPPPEYFSKVTDICKKYGVLFITDEVSTGFAKTGKMFACEHYGIVPDMIVIGKGLSSGYFPISATVVKPKIYEAFLGKGEEEAFMHGQTFQGHPLGCAAALENIKIIERENLVVRAKNMGEYLYQKLLTLLKHKMVARVSGIGLIVSIELVDKVTTNTRIPNSLGVKIKERAYELGLRCRFQSSSLGMLPPLVLSKKEANKIVEILDQTITEAERNFFL